MLMSHDPCHGTHLDQDNTLGHNTLGHNKSESLQDRAAMLTLGSPSGSTLARRRRSPARCGSMSTEFDGENHVLGYSTYLELSRSSQKLWDCRNL
jgi:hypothetical protein